MKAICHVCGETCDGNTGAVIDEAFKAMCHEGDSPTCYEEWCQTDSTVRLLTAIFGRPPTSEELLDDEGAAR